MDTKIISKIKMNYIKKIEFFFVFHEYKILVKINKRTI